MITPQSRRWPELGQNEPYEHSCELCRAEQITPWLYEDALCWVALCDTCYVPMMVFKPHREPDEEEQERMVEIARRLYPKAYLRFWRGLIPDHFHFHCDCWDFR